MGVLLPPITTKFPKQHENSLELFLSQRVDVLASSVCLKYPEIFREYHIRAASLLELELPEVVFAKRYRCIKKIQMNSSSLTFTCCHGDTVF